LLIANVMAAELPPPGTGLTAVSERLPAARKSVEGSAALTWVELINVVARGEPFTLMVVEGTKPVPVKVMTADAIPAIAELEDMEVMTGAGLSTSRLIAVELLAPFETTTGCSAPLASCVAGSAAVSCVALTKVVASTTPPTSTVLALLNPEPEIVSVEDADPAGNCVGLMDVMAGATVVVVVPPLAPESPRNTLTARR